MSTSEAQVMARALYYSVIGVMLGSLRTAATQLAAGGAAVTRARVDEILPPDTPVQVRNLVLLLAQEGKLRELPQIVSTFEQFASAQTMATSAEVISAVALDTAQQAKVAQQLRATYGDRLDLHFNVDPSILGGLVIRVGDQVFDNSARSRLSAVQRSMLSS